MLDFENAAFLGPLKFLENANNIMIHSILVLKTILFQDSFAILEEANKAPSMNCQEIAM